MTTLPHEKQIYECEETIKQVKEQNKANGLWSQEEIDKLEKKLVKLKQNVYSNLSPMDRIAICRHPNRPQSLDYIEAICDEFEEIHGDRTFGDDHAIVTGFGIVDGKKFVFIGQEKGKDTESRIHRNFGMAHPEGFRKALRAMKLAEKFHLPVVTFLDTQGAFPGLSAEERGQGRAIAQNLFEMAKLETPVITLVIGEGCSGGALGIGLGDRIGMLEHAYYSVISPEGCASILYKDSSRSADAAKALKMQSEDLIKLKIIDEIILEPQGGAHLDLKVVFENVKSFILKEYENLKIIPPKALIDKRYNKFRAMGEVSIT